MTDIPSPKVSVIMLTYNHKDTLARALDSVLAQRCSFPFEVLVGEDASTDTTAAILQQYADKDSRIVPVFRPENVGVTRNAYDLLMRARGQYIASCEGDDFWCDPDKLQRQVDFLDAHPDYVGCSHDVWLVDASGHPYSAQRLAWVSRHRHYTARHFKGLYLPGQSGSIVKRNFFRDGQDYSIVYEADPSVGDRTTILLCLAQGKFYRMKQRMACYTLTFDDSHSVTTERAHSASVLRREWQYTRRLEGYARQAGIPDVDFAPYKHSLFCSSVMANLLHNGKQDAALPKEILAAAPRKALYFIAFPIWVVLKLGRKCKFSLLKRRYYQVVGNQNGKAQSK